MINFKKHVMREAGRILDLRPHLPLFRFLLYLLPVLDPLFRFEYHHIVTSLYMNLALLSEKHSKLLRNIICRVAAQYSYIKEVFKLLFLIELLQLPTQQVELDLCLLKPTQQRSVSNIKGGRSSG